MSAHTVKKHNSDHTSNYKPKTASKSRSSGDFDRKTALLGEAITPTTVQCTSGPKVATSSSYSGSEEYYKKYDYDVMPVRDEAMTSQTTTDSENGERILISDSHLNALEKNISQDLKTDSSYNTLDSSIKVFKVTVETIFNQFNTNMKDFELYKKKFHELLSKDQEECVQEMEQFMKDMIHHIMSSTSSNFNSNCLRDYKNKVTVTKSAPNNYSNHSSLHDSPSVMEAFKNENYPAESTTDAKGSGSKQEWKESMKSSETFNIYLMSETPNVKIELNNKNHRHVSEIQIMEQINKPQLGRGPASADNINLTAQKLQYDVLTATNTFDFTDREIPVKISFAKKNIHSNEEVRDSNRSDKTFIAKLCSYICTKLRKAANMGL